VWKAFHTSAFARIFWGCVKSIPPPSAAEENFERTLFSLILLRKINENSVRSKHYLAASAAKGRPPAFLHNPIKF
jgi:hypothetical protein